MVGVVQYVENWRSKVPNGLVLVYWLFLSIIYLVKTLSLPPRPFHVNAPQTYVMFPIITALCIMEFSLEWLIPSLMQKKVVIGEESINPRVTADIFSEMFFNWLTPFMVHGYSNVIKEKDLYTLRDIDTADHVTPRFQRAWAIEENKKTPRLWLAITKAYGMEWIVPMIYELVGRALGLAQPILLQYFILWVASRNTEDPQSYAWGSVLAALMLLSTAFKTLFQQQSAQLFIETALRVKVSLQVQLYQKSIYLSNSAKKDMNVGDIVTRMSSDGQKVWMAVRLFPWTIAAPLEFIFSMVLLYRFLGWSMLAGVVLLIAISPLNALVIVFNQKFEKEQMDAKDKRTRLITEIVENMKCKSASSTC
jgi:ATP-binding cassette subfamily C (CFTR/MRP) protein 1